MLLLTYFIKKRSFSMNNVPETYKFIFKMCEQKTILNIFNKKEQPLLTK